MAAQLKEFAPESEKTRRARKKLLQLWEEEKAQITPEAIAEASEKIRKWIADNAKYRVRIEKGLELFNRNQNAATVSRKVAKLAEELRRS